MSQIATHIFLFLSRDLSSTFVTHSFNFCHAFLPPFVVTKYFRQCLRRTLLSLCWKYFVKKQINFSVLVIFSLYFFFSFFSVAAKLKGLFVLFAGYLVKNCASLLDTSNITKTGKVPPRFDPSPKRFVSNRLPYSFSSPCDCMRYIFTEKIVSTIYIAHI